MTDNQSLTDTLVIGGGCFWCTEAVYQLIEGVQSVESGYSGGHVKNPTYDDIGSGTSGHAEVIRIVFEPEKVSVEDILAIFWQSHDPTTLNRQGADRGTQYRSVILYKNAAQKTAAEKSVREAQEIWPDPIVTELSPLGIFYPAEDYHQDYYANNSSQGYCRVVIDPKLAKVRKAFKDKLKKKD